jgi:hypothetical protein
MRCAVRSGVHIVLSQKIVENLVSRLYADPAAEDARVYREALLGLVSAAKAEQRVVLAERRIAQPTQQDNVFSIESFR